MWNSNEWRPTEDLPNDISKKKMMERGAIESRQTHRKPAALHSQHQWDCEFSSLSLYLCAFKLSPAGCRFRDEDALLAAHASCCLWTPLPSGTGCLPPLTAAGLPLPLQRLYLSSHWCRGGGGGMLLWVERKLCSLRYSSLMSSGGEPVERVIGLLI